MTHQETVTLETRGHGDMHDLTGRVGDVVARSGIETGTVHAFNVGSTGVITMISLLMRPPWFTTCNVCSAVVGSGAGISSSVISTRCSSQLGKEPPTSQVSVAPAGRPSTRTIAVSSK